MLNVVSGEEEMETRRRVTSLGLILIGLLLAVGYPYLLYFTSEKTAIKVIKATLALVFIIIGAFLSSTGLVLYKGVKTLENNEK